MVRDLVTAVIIVTFVVIVAGLLTGCSQSQRFLDPYDSEQSEYKKISKIVGKADRGELKIGGSVGN